jgi:hypothetical protein
MFCTICRHLGNAFSFAHGGCGGFKRDRVASHTKKFHPKEQGTRDLGDLFEEGLRRGRERTIALIKEAYWPAYEGMPVHKFYSLTLLLWVASKLHRARRLHLGKNQRMARPFPSWCAPEITALKSLLVSASRNRALCNAHGGATRTAVRRARRCNAHGVAAPEMCLGQF